MPIHIEQGVESWFQSSIPCKSKIISVYYSASFVCLLIYVSIYLSETRFYVSAAGSVST